MRTAVTRDAEAEHPSGDLRFEVTANRYTCGQGSIRLACTTSTQRSEDETFRARTVRLAQERTRLPFGRC